MAPEQSSEPADRPSIPGYAIIDWPPCEGRTARVYRAVSLADGSPAAVKVLTASLSQGDFLDEAFRRETQSLSKLRHPNIVSMRGSGETASGERFIVLDWIDSNLERWKSGGGFADWLSFWQAVGRPLTSAVAHGHEKGVSHRDLAPRNILMTAAGSPMVADFGIAKLRLFMRTEQTLREFVSPPFTPPETDDGSDTPARDVFSLGALFCWCASGADLRTYAEVQSFAQSSEAFPPAVRQIVAEALSVDPCDRPAVAEQLLERLDLASSSLAPRTSLHCQLSLGAAQADRICRDFGLTDRWMTESAILDDLHSVCGIEPKPTRSGPASAFADLDVFGLSRGYHMRPDDVTRDRLVVLASIKRPSGWLEHRREAAITPKVEFRFSPGAAEADRRALATLQQVIDDHVQQRELAESDVENRLFDVWGRILQVKQEVESKRERPVRYHDYALDDRRVRFRLVGDVPAGAEMEKREIRLDDGSSLRGHIEEISGHEATFLISGGDPLQLRRSGEIVVNMHAANESLRRQNRALSAFRERSVVRPHMAEVLLEPTKAAPVARRVPAQWFQKDLDPDKRAAVEAALGSPDVLLLRGPPGTGKTTFISELVMQVLAEKPEARILLCSQTNVAIDNAVERLAQLRSEAGRDFELVRVGTNDELIAAAVEPHRLHRRLQAWTEEVRGNVEGYAERRAAACGVERKIVLIGMTIERLVDCQEDVRQAAIELHEAERDLAQIERLRGGTVYARPDEDVLGNVAARRLELSQLRERRGYALSEVAKLRNELRSLGEDEIADMEGSELDSALDLYLRDMPGMEAIRPLIELGADWTARFGRQDHFEGPFLAMAQVLAGTCLGVAGPRAATDLKYDLCIVDEASKATPTEMLVPLSRAASWVLVGDSKQLPPFQDEAMRDKKLLREYELRRDDVAESLFGYLERTLPTANVLSLSTQRRMVKPINDLIRACFYPDQELECARTSPGTRFAPVLKAAVTWLDTSRSPSRSESVPRAGHGVINVFECRVIDKLLRRLNKQFARRDPVRAMPKVEVAVIAGYSEQIKQLERTLRPRAPSWTHLELVLNTVDAFQGRQADLVVYSVTRSNSDRTLGFLREAPRLNVALSRGKDALVVVGDRRFCLDALGENPFRDVVRWIDASDAASVERAE